MENINRANIAPYKKKDKFNSHKNDKVAITERYPGKGSFGIMCLSSQLPKSMNNTYKRAHFVGNKANGRISKRLFQENKRAKFSEKRTFLTP